jgi:hypothetical protein
VQKGFNAGKRGLVGMVYRARRIHDPVVGAWVLGVELPNAFGVVQHRHAAVLKPVLLEEAQTAMGEVRLYTLPPRMW